MSDYFAFLYKHIELSIAFVVILLLILVEQFYLSRSKSGISPQNLVDFMNHKQAVVLDIRPTEDFNQGHIIHAINIPSQTLENNIKKLIKYKNTPVVVANEKGQDNAQILTKLKENGFVYLYTLSGGLTAWKEAGLPLVNSHRKTL